MGALKLEPMISFDPRAQAELASVGPLDFYVSEQSKNLAALFAVTWQGERCGTVLLRLEKTPDGELVMVVVAAVAQTPEPVLMMGKELIENIARQNGCTKMRCHTERPGIAAQFMRRGAEAVLTWDICNG